MSADAHGHGDAAQAQAESVGHVSSGISVIEVMRVAIAKQQAGLGSAVESNFAVETSYGPYDVHFHLCVHAGKRKAVN